MIRVFVSSTFRDMGAERDELVLRVFPRLRRLCEERDVTWGEIDLRWGITEEHAERGEVLPICLDEIRRCRPYFIGLLGERYGWVPEAIPPEVIEREPWIADHADGHRRKSVTELEIRHGVLNNPEMADRAFFYFRDPGYVATVPEERRSGYTSEGAESAEKLARLKEDIRQKHREGTLTHEPRENYRDAKALGALVLADFTALIDSLYPAGTERSPLERERADHDAFARSRAGVYVGRQEYFDRLDAHVAGDGPPLVVLGESGGGKSALLANWALRYRGQHPEDFALLHFIGSSPDSASATGMLRRIMLELKERFNLPDDVPAGQEKIREAFPAWLTNVAGSGRIVLVLDGLNQLEDVDAAPDLDWLPRVFPRYCRVIVSTLPGPSLESIRRRGWLAAERPLDVRPLDDGERRRLIREFLAQYTRDLGPKRTDRLVDAPQTANPLYLRVLLDELRVFGIYEELNDRIDWYLEAGDPRELYRKVIRRWEDAYGGGTELVRDVLSMLWAARRGLSEAELLEALRRQGRPLPYAEWSPLYLAMSTALVTRSGLLTFAHDFLRAAARDECLPAASDQQAAHRRLAEYFTPRETDTRRVDELPWQLYRSGELGRLEACLADLPFFAAMMERDRLHELVEYWSAMPDRMREAYHRALLAAHRGGMSIEDLGVRTAQVAGLMIHAGRHDDAAALCLWALGPANHHLGEAHPVAFALASNLALAMQFKGDLRGAAEHQQYLLDLAQARGGQLHATAAVMGNLALTMNDAGDYAAAEHYGREALRVIENRFGPDDPRTAMMLNNLGLTLLSAGKFREAEDVYGRALAIRQAKLGARHPMTAYTLAALGSLYIATGRPEEAAAVLRESLAIREQALGPQHPELATTLNELGAACRGLGDLKEALRLFSRAREIYADSFGTDHPRHAMTQNNIANILLEQGKVDEAEPLFRAALETRRHRLGPEHPDTAGSQWALGVLLAQKLDFAAAGPLLDQALATSRKVLGDDHPQTRRMADQIRAFEPFRNVRVIEQPTAERGLAEERDDRGAPSSGVDAEDRSESPATITAPDEHTMPQGSACYGGDLDDMLGHILGGDARDNAILAKTLYNRGLFEESRGNPMDAVRAYALAVKADPSLGPAYFNVAQICLRHNDDEGACYVLEKLLSVAPQDTESRIQLVGVHTRLGNKDTARAHLSRVCDEISNLWDAGHHERLLPLLIDVNATVKDDGRVLYMIGHIYRETGEFQKALEHLRRAQELLPGDQVILLEIKLAEERSPIHVEPQKKGGGLRA